MTGFYKRNKAELEQLLAETKPEISVSAPHAPQTSSSFFQRVKEYVKSKWNSFANWLFERIPPKPKIVDKVFDVFKKNFKTLPDKKIEAPPTAPSTEEAFEVTETEKALKNFTTQYTI